MVYIHVHVVCFQVSRLNTQQLENIAIFCAILIARHCFSVYDFLKVALVSLTRHGKTTTQ